MSTLVEKIELLTLQELFNSNNLIIPAFQRNYVWDDAVVGSVLNKILKNFSNDITIREMTFGMITVHTRKVRKEHETINLQSNPNLYVIDGQQRMITLKLIFNALSENPDDNPVNLSFERDDKIEDKRRIDFISKLGYDNSEQPYSVDTKRIKIAYEKIEQMLAHMDNDKVTKTDTINKILNSIKILVHYTKTQPNIEFLNLNFNKNRFSLADYAKTYMIITAANKNKPTEQIVDIFKNLSKELYINIKWEVLKTNYELKLEETQKELENKVENRLDILFKDKDSVDELNYIENLDNELEKLEFSLKMTKEMLNYANTQNGFLWIAHPKGKEKLGYGFYELIHEWFQDNNTVCKPFNWFMLSTIIKENTSWHYLNGFLEIQLRDKKIENMKELKLIRNEFPISWHSEQCDFYGKKPDASLIKGILKEVLKTL